MKKLIWFGIALVLSLGLCVILASNAHAEDISLSNALENLPGLKQGVAYSFSDSDFSYLSTIELAEYKGLTLEAGYSSKDKIVAVISYPLLKLKKYLDLPILNLVELNIGAYAGYGRISIDRDFGEFDAGISATLINVKF